MKVELTAVLRAVHLVDTMAAWMVEKMEHHLVDQKVDQKVDCLAGKMVVPLAAQKGVYLAAAMVEMKVV